MQTRLLACTAVFTSVFSLVGCNNSKRIASAPHIVGAWVVYDTSAPFHQHMYVFNADGTMQQANPDAGDARTSDSDGKGIWVVDGSGVKGKWVEITADRVTHQFVGRGEYSYSIAVDKDNFTGTATMQFYDAQDAPMGDPIRTTMTGKRVTLP